MIMATLLEEVRRRLGPAPRTLSFELGRIFARPPLKLAASDDPLRRVWDEYFDIITTGEVALGHIFMQNSDLFRVGSGDRPAAIVYSFDPLIHHQPGRLKAIGDLLYRHHGGSSDPVGAARQPSIRRLRTDLWSGLARPMGQPVPPLMTNGLRVWYASTMVFRNHLPAAVLMDPFVPVMVRRSVQGGPPLIVPWQLWPQAWVLAWRDREGA